MLLVPGFPAVQLQVSEWTQQFGLALLTKRLIETGSKESSDDR